MPDSGTNPGFPFSFFTFLIPMSDHFSTISIQPEAEPQAPKPTRHRKKREPFGKKLFEALVPRNPYLIAALIVALLFASYCGVGFLLAPSLITGKIVRAFQKNTELEFSAGKTEFNPFTFTLHLVDISLRNTADTTQSPALLQAADLLIDLDPISLVQKKLACNFLRIDKLSVNIIRYGEKKFNVSQIFKASDSTASADLLNFTDLPFLFSLNAISLADSTVVFDDRTTGKTHKIEKIELAIPTLANFSYKVKTTTVPRFSAVVNGSPVQLTGDSAMSGDTAGDQTRLSFDLHALDLPLYFGYLPFALPVQLLKGTADGRLQVSFAPGSDRVGRLSVVAQMTMKDMDLQSQDQTLTMTVPSAQLDGELQPFTGDLHLNTLLFHEPEIRLKKEFSEKTLDGLLPAQEKTTADSTPAKAAAQLAMDLFVMDNGTLRIQESHGKKESEKTYNALQLSLKNYGGKQPAGKDAATAPCTFKLTGEQSSPAASFSWQGELDATAHGTLQLNRYPASLLEIIFTEEKEASMTGTADMTGNLSVRRNLKGKKLFTYTITDGSVKISDFGISERQHEWVHAASLTMGPLDSKDNVLDIGNIFLQKANVTLQRDRLPLFLESFMKKGSGYKVHGIDFSGTVVLKANESSKTPLILNDLALQANNLERDPKDKENIAVTGKIGQAGELKAKGTVALGPFRSSLAVEFSGLQARELLPWYTDSAFLLDGQARLDGVGRLTSPETTYKGSLRVSDARFDNKAAKSSLAWATANMHEFSFTRRPFAVGIAIAEIDRAVLTYLYPDEKMSLFDDLSSFLQDLLPKKEPEKGAKTSPVPTLQIKEIRLTNGTVSLKDLRLNPPWQQEITAMQGQIQNVQAPSAGTGAAYSFSGTIAGRPIGIEGTADCFARPLSASSTLTMSAMPLAVFKDQISPLLDIDPGKGTFDLTVKDAWRDGRESGEAAFLFHGVSPSSPSADTAVPLALLNDRQDTFELRVPLVDPEEKQPSPVFTDTTRYFKRLVVKSVVAPLLLTNDTFSRLAVDDTPDFLDGESTLSDKGKAKLTLYKDLLLAHPRLKIEISGLVDTAADKTALQEKLNLAEKKRVDEENARRAQEWQRLQSQKQPHAGNRNTAIVEKDIPPEELARYAPIFPKQVFVSDQAMHDLADKRTAAAVDFFTNTLGLDAERIARHRQEQGDEAESMNRVRITLHALAVSHASAAPRPDSR